ncbi:MAG: WbuC family cupin fold metalloprotein [Candidatus Cryptobacteroides sp.]
MVIDKKLINSLFDQAVVNPRLRINYDLRNSDTDGSQRMLNAMMPGTSVPIHRHPNSSESIMIVCGSVDEVFYDDNGTETERIHLNPESLSFGCQVPKRTWHSIEVYEPSIIFEAKEGRYGHDRSEYLHPEEAPEAYRTYTNNGEDLKRMVEYIIGEEVHSGNSDRLSAETFAERLGVSVHDVQKIMDELNY